MYAPMDIDGQEYYIKPMNCPFHIMIYKSQTRSYRDLPLRWAELGTVYRYERSGTLHGLLRVRGFTQDDAHIICTPDQIDDEILRVLDFSLNLLRGFGFEEFRFDLSVRDPDNAGQVRRRGRDVAAGRGLAGQGAAGPRPALRADGRRSGLLWPQDRHPHQGRRWAARGSARRSSSTLTCRAALT